MSYFVLLNAMATKDNQKEAFKLIVSEPIDGSGDCFCEVEAPLLFDGRKSIHGADADQAKELAVNFVKEMIGFSGWQLTDREGSNIEILN